MSIEAPMQLGGYSALVKLFLHAGGTTHQPTQVSDNEIFFGSPTTLNPGPAVVDILVDATTRSYPIEILEHPSATTRIPIRLPEHTATIESVNQGLVSS